jgi:glycosyl hydrolase family 76
MRIPNRMAPAIVLLADDTMSPSSAALSRAPKPRVGATLLLIGLAGFYLAPPAAGAPATVVAPATVAARATVAAPRARAASAHLAADRYPNAVSRPLIATRRAAVARAATPSRTTPPRTKRARKRSRKPQLRGNPARAQRAFEAMQKYFYLRGSGLYAGEPFSYLWPFSQALAATVSIANVPSLKSAYIKEIDARLLGLSAYLDNTNSGAAEGAYTSTLAAYDGTAAPPVGPGGTKYYDDNGWVGIELARIYKLTHNATALGAAEEIMAFEMAGWQTNPELSCPGGIPFSNATENTDRNTVTDGPVAELGVQLYLLTGNVGYLQFAQTAYEWVRRCLLQPGELYADHITSKGVVEPTLWSYNQGTMIGAGTLLYQATGNGAYLYQARQTARAALAYFTPERLATEIPFFPSIYFRNLLYLDSVTHDPPGPSLAQAYVNYAWLHLRLNDDLFVSGSPPGPQLLVQAAITQIYALLSSPASTAF